MTIVDAHHHVWDLAVRDQPWIAGQEMAAIRRTFTVDDLRPAARAAGVGATVVVQTVTVAEETPKNSVPFSPSTAMASSRTSASTPVATDAAMAGRCAQSSWSRVSKTAARNRARRANRADAPDSGKVRLIDEIPVLLRTCPEWDCSHHLAMSDDAHMSTGTSSDSATSVRYARCICR